jgi:hypothetical protein
MQKNHDSSITVTRNTDFSARVASEPDTRLEILERYVPLLVWMGVALTVLFIALKIIGYGYLPPDDALRHAGKVVSGKPWSEILVMQERFSLDHNPGWHVVLGSVRRLTGWGTDSLVAFSVASLFILFGVSSMPWLRRPEAWLATLLVFAIAAPSIIGRMSLGRPFILTMVVLVILLLIWTRHEAITWPLLTVTTLMMALSVWVHGSWYLLILPIGAFFLCAQWRKGFALTGCWLVGVLLGATLTGHPFKFIYQAVDIMFSCFGNHLLHRNLVSEFQPSDGNFAVLVLVALILLWRHARGEWTNSLIRNPILVLAALGWLLGLRVVRFWEDWGQPALMLWAALELQEVLRQKLAHHSWKRLVFAIIVAGAAYSVTTSDRAGRWSWNLTREYLTPENEDVVEWLPGPGGIVYSSDMGVFYRTFFKNPTAPWRYILGFESTFMPADDLAVHRNIQWNYGAAKAYAPWVAKMREQDRLIITAGSGAKPAVDGLEWYYAATDTWVGRLPRVSSSAPTPISDPPQ